MVNSFAVLKLNNLLMALLTSSEWKLSLWEPMFVFSQVPSNIHISKVSGKCLPSHVKSNLQQDGVYLPTPDIQWYYCHLLPHQHFGVSSDQKLTWPSCKNTMETQNKLESWVKNKLLEELSGQGSICGGLKAGERSWSIVCLLSSTDAAWPAKFFHHFAFYINTMITKAGQRLSILTSVTHLLTSQGLPTNCK